MFASSLSLYILKIQILHRRKEALRRYSDVDYVDIKGILCRFWLFAENFLLLLEGTMKNITLE